MPHIGILGANPDGAALCFLTYCREGARRLGGHTYPDVTLDYIGFGHGLAAWQAGDEGAVSAQFARSTRRLAAAGASFFVCPDNTAHLALERPGTALDLPGLHIARIVADEARTAGYRRIGILGTRTLVESDLYPRWLGSRGIEVEAPTGEQSLAMDRIIYGELVNGVVTDVSRQQCLDTVERFVQQGCDAVVLASTELPPLLGGESPLPVVDSAALVSQHALDVALGDQPLPTWRGGPDADLTTPSPSRTSGSDDPPTHEESTCPSTRS